MKLIAYLTVLLSIAAKGDDQCPPMNTCIPPGPDSVSGEYSVFYCDINAGSGDSIDVRKFKGQCGNGKKDITLDTTILGQYKECCQRRDHVLVPSNYAMKIGLSCKRQEEVLKIDQFTWKQEDCNARLFKPTIDDRDVRDSIGKACDGQRHCDAYFPYGANNPDVCRGGYGELLYSCYYDFDNPPLKQADPSTSTKRRLQRHHGGGGFNNGNTNTGSNTGVVSTLETVIANCNGGRIQLINTCSIAAQSVCNGQPSCYYPITTQNSPECGNYASFGYQCY